ncbi:DnaT-like ssDNA-binding domain-containing protein [Endozoicomonas arenosclerae]|uniref:DnaT-like ssDNA-binding domain-containing protein n=1 Tax=Endozoicomonas arenosclerae TaxID=1633495 RepID=UPI0007837850|nr:DnaT-like ssDNA-binding domain-containing protein [Endozoicomonas arenosclerae]
MTDEDQKRYIRQRNAGALPWELEGADHQKAEEHPVFGQQTTPSNTLVEGARVQPLPNDFTPDPVYIEFLEEHHGIPADFTLAQLPEFKLYWLETGEARKAWQNKFKNHVIYQWKRSQSETGQRANRSTAEKLTDTSWADGLQLDFGDSDEP